MVTDDLPEHKPEITPLVPLGAELTFPDNDAGPAPACCPTCGRPSVLFTLRASGALDMVVLAQAVLSDLKAAIEEELVP